MASETVGEGRRFVDCGSNGSASDDGIEIFVPGRLCLFGEHSDWSGGMRKYNGSIRPGCTIVTGLQGYGLFANCSRLHQKVVQFCSTTDGGESSTREFDLDDEDGLVHSAQSDRFWGYVAGVSYIFATQFHVGGMKIVNYRTTLPLRKGLSSSAAVCVLVARAFNEVYHLGLTTRGIMQAAFEGERLTLSQCGRMDQAVAFGGVLTLMRFSGDIMSTSSIQLGGRQPLHIVLVDLHAKKDTVQILNSLQSAFPHPSSEEQCALVRLLGETNEMYIEYALAALSTGDLQTLGRLMSDWQRDFDEAAGPLCPDQLGINGSPILHRVLSHGPIQNLIYGGKGVGSQGDGTAQLLCKGYSEQEDVVTILERDFDVACLKVTLHPTSMSMDDQNVEAAPGKALVHRLNSIKMHEIRLETELRLLRQEMSRLNLEIKKYELVA